MDEERRRKGEANKNTYKSNLKSIKRHTHTQINEKKIRKR